MNKLFKRVAIVVCAFFLAFGSAHAAPKFSSQYTNIYKDCDEVGADPSVDREGTDTPADCKGYGGYRIHIFYSASSAVLEVSDAKGESLDWQISNAFTGFDDSKVEWRMADGKPFAVIVRIKSDSGASQSLEVRGIGAYAAITGTVAANTVNANAAARRIADRGYALWKR